MTTGREGEMLKNTLYVVIPCYNEEDVLNETAGRLLQKFHDLIGAGKIAENSRIVFVNDGSADGTWGTHRGPVQAG